MRILVVALALSAAPLAAQTRPATPAERAGMQADYNRDLARLRLEHQQTLARIRTETAALERKVDVVRRMIPVKFEADLIEKHLQGLAQASEMPPLEIKRVDGRQKVRLADGGATPYERSFLEVAGRDHYISVGFFLDRLGRLPLVVELETLELEAGPQDTVRFVARLAFPCDAGWPEAAPAAPPAATPLPGSYASLDDERSALERSLLEHRKVLARAAEAAREPIRRMQAEVFAVDEMKRLRAPARFFAALARFDTAMAGRPVALSRARFGAGSVIEGAAGSAEARAALRPAFQSAGFVLESMEMAIAGECRTFTLAARLAPREAAGDPTSGAVDVEVGPNRFDLRATTNCGATPQPPKGRVAARGTSGDVSVRLRDTDVADVFHVLARLTGASFVVDADVKGRVDVDFERATLDEAVAAMASAGVTIGSGALRRVSRAGGPPVARLRATSDGHAISLFFKDGVLLDVLRLFQEISSLPVWTSPVADGRVTIFASEVPWDLALEGIAASVSMKVSAEPERLFVGPAAMARSPWKSGAVTVERAKTEDDDADWVRVVELSKIGMEDLTPLGLARTAEGAKGVAYGPGRLLWLLEPGAELFEARVEAVGPSGVTFTAKDGVRTEVRFTP